MVSDDALLQASQPTLSETVQEIEKKLALLQLILAQNPEFAKLRIIGFNPTTTVLKSALEAARGIFNATGKFIGRNLGESSNYLPTEYAENAGATIKPKTAQELVSENPRIQHAINKLRELSGKIDYRNPRGRGAVNPSTWIEHNLIEKNLLTKEDVQLLPLFAWREISPNCLKRFQIANHQQNELSKAPIS